MSDSSLSPYAGWHLVAFAADLQGEISPLEFGDHPLIAVRHEGCLRVFDATCPHRGGHLGYGGKLERDCVVCPFHGRRIHLGSDHESPYRVTEHEALLVGDALFVRFADGPDRGFHALVGRLAKTHDVVPGFMIAVRVAPEIIVENAFDPEHFVPVHGVVRPPQMTPSLGAEGELIVSSALPIPVVAGAERRVVSAFPVPFFAVAVSPTLVVTRLGPGEEAPYYFTGTIPTADGCVARVAVAAPKLDGRPASPEGIAELVAGSREAFREDIPVWEHLAKGHVPFYDSRDASVVAFREFVGGFAR
jgi:3-ketosteroid 9alpha-monooxygenase subunit A